jgi:hypothetical protein
MIPQVTPIIPPSPKNIKGVLIWIVFLSKAVWTISKSSMLDQGSKLRRKAIAKFNRALQYRDTEGTFSDRHQIELVLSQLKTSDFSMPEVSGECETDRDPDLN